MSGLENLPPRRADAPRTTTFDQAWRKIEREARGPEKPYSPRAAARIYLTAERATSDAMNDDALGQLGEVSTSRLERIAATRSRDFGDVAAKLAALIVEHGQEEPVSSGGVPAAIHAGLCSCLADLVILAERPLPDASAVLDMREPDFELRDATEAEAAEFRAELLEARRADEAAHKAREGQASARPDDGRQRDSFDNLTIEGDRLKSSLAGWHEILLALRDLAEKRPLKADAFDPLLTEIGGMFDELDPIEPQEAAE